MRACVQFHTLIHMHNLSGVIGIYRSMYIRHIAPPTRLGALPETRHAHLLLQLVPLPGLHLGIEALLDMNS